VDWIHKYKNTRERYAATPHIGVFEQPEEGYGVGRLMPASADEIMMERIRKSNEDKYQSDMEDRFALDNPFDFERDLAARSAPMRLKKIRPFTLLGRAKNCVQKKR